MITIAIKFTDLAIALSRAFPVSQVVMVFQLRTQYSCGFQFYGSENKTRCKLNVGKTNISYPVCALYYRSLVSMVPENSFYGMYVHYNE